MSYLLISPEGAATLRGARRQQATAEQVAQFQAARAAEANTSGLPRIAKQAGGTVEVAVTGVLSEAPDFFSTFFGGGNTTYRDIRTALQLADADPSVQDVVLSVSSPGGFVEGLFETLDALAAFSKPIRSQASLACSAAYGIVAMTQSVRASTDASMFGSVGVAVSLLAAEDIIDLTNTASPDKRPDPTTDDGKAVIQAELDAIFQLFAGRIARGRGTTLKRVTEEFGRGATLVAATAKQRGMIDTVAPPPAPRRRSTSAQSEPVQSLAELLATRLPEESSEDYVRRCSALLDRLPAEPARAAGPKQHTAQQLADAVEASLPSAFPLGLPSKGAKELLDGLTALPGAGLVTIERKVDREALGAAVEREYSLDWGLAGDTEARR